LNIIVLLNICVIALKILFRSFPLLCKNMIFFVILLFYATDLSYVSIIITICFLIISEANPSDHKTTSSRKYFRYIIITYINNKKCLELLNDTWQFSALISIAINHIFFEIKRINDDVTLGRLANHYCRSWCENRSRDRTSVSGRQETIEPLYGVCIELLERRVCRIAFG